jgi:hypothetical protein
MPPEERDYEALAVEIERDNRLTAAKLRIVARDGASVSESGSARVSPTGPSRRGRKPRMPPIDDLFSPITLEMLHNRQFDVIHPPITRLYHFIVAQSYRGTQPFDLTNKMAAKLGIDRFQKSRHLAELERLGLVTVIRDGQATVRVSATG